MTRFPQWLKKRLVVSETGREVEALIYGLGLHTVCESASCPNKSECFSEKRATFMILGDVCTRDCAYCGVRKGRPAAVDAEEPERIARAVSALGLRHVIITSVTRDDLADGGAGHFSRVAGRVKEICGGVTLEVLTPDFKGDHRALDTILGSPIEIFSHNLETVEALYKKVRPQADYGRSLDILRAAKRRARNIKSGIMVGLGETAKEVGFLLRDLRNAGCTMLTIGQYLRPSKKQLAVAEFIHPDIFAMYNDEALSLGFERVASGPFVRSSYMKGA